MAAGEADRRADAVGVEERSAVRCPLMKRLYISMPPDLTMMVEEALALIERQAWCLQRSLGNLQENLKIENFRALRNVELKNLTPLTVLLGPNGSGKSTVFDVFAFLSECFESGLRRAPYLPFSSTTIVSTGVSPMFSFVCFPSAPSHST
jgi:AAA domain